MADLAIGVSKTAVDLVVNKVKDAIKEEAAQWQIVQRDVVFITGEFEMMQSFLVSADGDRVRNNHVARTWVRQVRDLSYDVEDCIEFVLHLDSGRRSWWFRLVPSWARPRAALPVDEAVAEITQLKARVEDVSQRNTRYSLIGDDSGSKPAAPTTSPSAFGILTAGAAPNKNMLHKAMNWGEMPLQVISVAGATRFDIGRTSVIRNLVYDNGRTRENFERRAWVKLMDPFDPHEFIRSLVAQFLMTSPCEDGKAITGVDALMKLEEIQGSNNLVKLFAQEVDAHRYLIVLDDVSSIEQWDAIKSYLPDKNNGSRVIVSTHHAEIAILCTGKPYRVSVLQQSSTDQQPYHVLHTEVPKQSGATTSAPKQGAPPLEAGLVGRNADADELLELIKAHRHVSVWGPPGVGKTALVKSAYDRYRSGGFYRRGWANLSHPFNGQGLAQDLLSGLLVRDGAVPFGPVLQQSLALMAAQGDPVRYCHRTLRSRRSLVVIDGLTSKAEWDWIKANITSGLPVGWCVISVSAEENIATHCAETSDGAVYRVNSLDAAPSVKDEQAVRRIVSKCTGLPKSIITLAHHLDEIQRTEERDMEIRLLNDNLMHQLDNNSEFNCFLDLFGWLLSNFDASPQVLKKCIFYLHFSTGQHHSSEALVRRWIAEGYSNSKGTNSSSLVEEAEKLSDKLVNLWIILPQQTTTTVSGATTGQLQVNSLFLEQIIASRQAEERTFLPLEVSVLEVGRRLATEHVGQHLAIHSSWKREEFVYRGLDFSQLRSLTVSGEWEPFFISDKMRVVRVLDLEGTTNLKDGDLDKIGETLPRLKFLSLRGCRGITYLPASVCDLRQLETLDIRHTSITMLPMSFVRLQKLQYISAGTQQFFPGSSSISISDADMDLSEAAASTSAEPARAEVELRITPERGEELPVPAEQREEAEEELPAPPDFESEMPQSGCWSFMKRQLTRHLRASYCFSTMERQACFQSGGGGAGVGLRPGMSKLKASLHTLGVVDGNSGAGMMLLFQLSWKLPQLRKLAVCGLRWDDTIELLLAISWHDKLESLSLQADKLLWHFRLPSSLVKLSLDVTGVLKQAAVDALMDHKKLRTLRLRVSTPAGDGDQPGVVVRFFPGTYTDPGIEGRFDGLKVLEIAGSARLHVMFSDQAVQELELLRVHCCGGSPPKVSGLQHLHSLKHVFLVGNSCDDTLREALQKQLDEHPKKLMLVRRWEDNKLPPDPGMANSIDGKA